MFFLHDLSTHCGCRAARLDSLPAAVIPTRDPLWLWQKRSRRYSSSEFPTRGWVLRCSGFLVMRRALSRRPLAVQPQMPYSPRVTLFTLTPFFFFPLLFFPFLFSLVFSLVYRCLFDFHYYHARFSLGISLTNLYILRPRSRSSCARAKATHPPDDDCPRYVVAAGCMFFALVLASAYIYAPFVMGLAAYPLSCCLSLPFSLSRHNPSLLPFCSSRLPTQ